MLVGKGKVENLEAALHCTAILEVSDDRFGLPITIEPGGEEDIGRSETQICE
jgi:hypothetical protein